MARQLIAWGALALAVPAQAGQFVFRPVPTEGQQIMMDAGVPIIQSNQPRTAIQVRAPDEGFSKRAILQVVVMNGDEKPFNFGTENISGTLPEGGAPVQVLTVGALQKEEKRRAGWAAFGAALTAMGNSMNAANAGYSQSYGSFNTNTYGSVGTTPFYGNSYTSGSVTTYNSGQAYIAQSLANQQNNEMFANMANANAARMQEIKQVIATTTVVPGGSYGGLLQFDIPSKIRALAKKTPMRVQLNFQVGEETHQVQLEMSWSK